VQPDLWESKLLTLLRLDEKHGIVVTSLYRRVAHTKRMLLNLGPSDRRHRQKPIRISYHLEQVDERHTHVDQLASPNPASSSVA